MPWRAASTASGYVPTLLAVSPFAAIRSAPTITTSTSPVAMRWPAATSGSSVCGTPAWASSQAVSRAPCMVSGLDDAQRGPELAACQRPGVAVGQDVERAVLGEDQGVQAGQR